MTEQEYLIAQKRIQEADALRQDIAALREGIRYLEDAKNPIALVVTEDYFDKRALTPSPEVLKDVRNLLLHDQMKQLEVQQEKFKRLEIP